LRGSAPILLLHEQALGRRPGLRPA
jgi:hypothetical protein